MLLKKVNRFARRVLFVLGHLGDVLTVVNDRKLASSYYPDEERKSKTRILLENLWWLARHGEVCADYYLYGFDRMRVGSIRDYLPYTVFKSLRNRCNNAVRIGAFNASYTCLLKDKFVFHMMLEALDCPTPRLIALARGNEFRWFDSPGKPGIEALRDSESLDVMCKSILGECGNGVFRLRKTNGGFLIKDEPVTLEKLVETLKQGYIVQERVTQHPRMSLLYPRSVNTLRLVTVNDGKEATLLEAALKIGAHGATIDNWAAGNLIGGVDRETGRLDEHFFFKPGYGGRIEKHPDTGAVFREFTVPFFREAVRVARELHNFLYGIHSVGWDIAIGEKGPIIIEGNDNWEITPFQAFDGSAGKRFLSSLPLRG